MCGLAGYIDYRNGAEASLLRSMAMTLAHRGPDAFGLHVEGPLGLAHQRLSIIDTQSSAQPMLRPGAALSFNGELYNYQALRQSLPTPAAGWQTRGDTEVLMQGLRVHGTSFLAQIQGMFAAAHWNTETEELLLLRDPYGIKPLYYAEPRPGLIVFGSEPKALLMHPEVSAELDLKALRQVVRKRAVYGSRSPYRQIRQLGPGMALRWSRAGSSQQAWYDLVERIAQAEERDYQRDELLARLQNAVEKRLVADVPVGCFLSGGIDSALLVALMRRLQPHQELRTFSASFEDDPRDEFEQAAQIAAQFHTQHERVRVGMQDFIESMAEYSRLRDAPLSEPADVAIGKLSQHAKQSVKVVLSGEGADEAFAGYPKYTLANLPRPLRSLVRRVPPAMLGFCARGMGLSTRRVEVAQRALSERSEHRSLAQWFAVAGTGQSERLFPQLFRGVDQSANYVAERQALARIQHATSDVTRRMQFVDLATWLPGNLLERGDRMTMAAGLESRMPYLCPEVLEYGLMLRRSQKADLRRTKLPLRDLARHLISNEMGSRKKWGFHVPLESWFKSELGDHLHELLLSPSSFSKEYGDPKESLRVLHEHRQGAANNQSVLWSLLSLETWYGQLAQHTDHVPSARANGQQKPGASKPASGPDPVPAAGQAHRPQARPTNQLP